MQFSRSISSAFIFTILVAISVQAQFIDDAVRLVDNPTSIGARSQAMGNAFVGVSDDFSAVYWNPAGLGLIRRPEFSFGITRISTSNDATFIGSTTNAINSNTILNNIGFVLPFPVLRGSLVFAIGYNRINNFTGSRAFDAFNSQSSILPTLYAKDVGDDLAWNLGLEDTTGYVPIRKNVNQKGDVFESGGLNQWAFSGSVEIMHNLSVGATFGIYSGSYRWERTFSESDTRDLYQGVIAGKDVDRTDFRNFSMDEAVTQDLSGWNSTLGMIYNFNDKGRLGLSIKTPSFISVKENYDQSGKSNFAQVSERYSFATSLNDYTVITTWIFSVGGSVNPADFFTVAADVDLIDYSQLEFDNAATTDIGSYFRDLNRKIKNSQDGLRPTTNYRVGTELTIPQTGVQVRGGFNYRPSPYKEDEGKSEFDSKTFSVGLGYLFENTFLLNATFSRSSFSTFQTNYSQEENVSTDFVRTNEKVANTSILFSLAYRF